MFAISQTTRSRFCSRFKSLEIFEHVNKACGKQPSLLSIPQSLGRHAPSSRPCRTTPCTAPSCHIWNQTWRLGRKAVTSSKDATNRCIEGTCKPRPPEKHYKCLSRTSSVDLAPKLKIVMYLSCHCNRLRLLQFRGQPHLTHRPRKSEMSTVSQ